MKKESLVQFDRRLNRIWTFFAPFFVVFLGLDQISKEWALANLKLYENVNFGFALSRNDGMVFGFNLPAVGIYLITICILGLGIYLVIKEKLWQNHWHLFALALLFSGAIGNLIDRVRFGYVVDFIKVYWWPTFNIADIGIVLGVILLAWGMLFREKMMGKL